MVTQQLPGPRMYTAEPRHGKQQAEATAAGNKIKQAQTVAQQNIYITRTAPLAQDADVL